MKERISSIVRSREFPPILIAVLEVLTLVALLNIKNGSSSLLDVNQRPFSDSLASHVKEVTRFVYPLWD